MKGPAIRRGSAAFLRAVIVLIATGVLAAMIWEPHIEGRNAHASIYEIYFNDPFLAYVYAASIPFFVALYQAFRFLGYIERNEVFSPGSVRALRTIKHSAMAIVGLVAVSVIFMMFGDRDDRPAGIFMRMLIAFSSMVVAVAAAMFESILQNAQNIKSKNDSTV